MNQAQIEVMLHDHEGRLTTVQQILPTLLTRDDFKTAMAKLATKEDLRAQAAMTKEELRAHSEEIRRHFDVISESLRSDIKLVAEGVVYLTQRLDTFEHRVDARFEGVETHLTRLEARRRR